MRSNWKSIIIEDKRFSKRQRELSVSSRINYSLFSFLLFNYKLLAKKANILRSPSVDLTPFSMQRFKIFSSNLLETLQQNKQKELNIWQKSKVIFYQNMEQPYRVNIYNGRLLASILINEMKNGGRYGEFIFTKGSRVVKVKSKKGKGK